MSLEIIEGKFISEELRELLRQTVTKEDKARAGEETGQSFSTMRDVTTALNPVTAKSKQGLVELTKIALENIPELRKKIDGYEEQLRELLERAEVSVRV